MAMMKINQQALKDGLKNEEYCTFGHSAGALYATVIVDLAKVNFENTIDFAKQFYAEENVKAFPGEFFTSKVPFIRLVISCQNEKILAFLERFTRFCKRHLRVSQ
jgi:aspartate/methionine/tyrosine aminotransferase